MKNAGSLVFVLALAGSLFGPQAMALEYGGVADDLFPDTQPIAYSGKLPGVNANVESTPGQGCPHLSLTTEQLEKLSALKDVFLDGIDPKITQIKSLKRQLLAESIKQSPDRAKALQIQAQINSVKADIANARVNYGFDKFALMTPDQQETLRRGMLLKHVFGRFHHHGGSSHSMARPEWTRSGNFKADAPESMHEPVDEISGLF